MPLHAAAMMIQRQLAVGAAVLEGGLPTSLGQQHRPSRNSGSQAPSLPVASMLPPSSLPPWPSSLPSPSLMAVSILASFAACFLPAFWVGQPFHRALTRHP